MSRVKYNKIYVFNKIGWQFESIVCWKLAYGNVHSILTWDGLPWKILKTKL